MDAIDVQAGPQIRGTVVAFGDSITDGYQSTVNANARWPNDLARNTETVPDGGQVQSMWSLDGEGADRLAAGRS